MGARRRFKNRFPRNYCPLEYLECLGYNQKGQGIVIWKEKEFYVDELIIGEKARILIYYEEKAFGNARAIQLELPSPKRALPLGHWKFSLGAYHLSHLNDQAQDELKQKWVNETFNYQALPLIVGKRAFYRNKVLLHHGGFLPPGRWRRKIVIPKQYDLMEIDFAKYQNLGENIIIRRIANQEIVGKPGDSQTIIAKMAQCQFIVGLNSFYQVNDEMALLAYQAILDEIKPDDIVFDLFGGAATIGIFVAKKAFKVYSVDINKESHQLALKNIELNGCGNVYAILSDANTWILQNQEKPDVIVIDPPRSGLNKKAMEAINCSGAKKVIYLSCNIYSQKKDIDYLTNYQITKIQPYDFFPQTFHVENLIVLNKIAPN